MEAARLSRKNLRPQLLSGKSRGKGGCPLGEGWLKEKRTELLNAHFSCKEPGEAACLQDALSMTFSGKPRSAGKGRGERKSHPFGTQGAGHQGVVRQEGQRPGEDKGLTFLTE